MWSKHLLTHGIALTGALAFLFAGLPLPWLFGPMFSCLLAALWGVKLVTIKPLGEGMRTILGVAVGATVTWAFLQGLPSLWTTLLMVLVMTVLIGVVGVWYFRRVRGYDFPTAYYASMPGGLQDMIAFGEEAGGNVRAISLIHATRVLVIVIILPFVLTALWEVDLHVPPGQTIGAVPLRELGVLAVCAIVGWRVAKRLGMLGASILGPLLLAAIASLLDLLHSRPPAEAIWAAQYFIALGIGVKYVGITGEEIRKDIAAGLGFCLFLLVLTVAFIGVVLAFDLAPPVETILALAPGGQAELVVLALIVGADMTFVVAHHLLRIFFVILGAPVFAAIIERRLRD